jgi:hypothetical protein
MFAIYLPKLERYVRRESYGNIGLVKHPEEGTLYNRQSDAEFRKRSIIDDNSWRKNPNYGTVEIHEIVFISNIIKIL